MASENTSYELYKSLNMIRACDTLYHISAFWETIRGNAYEPALLHIEKVTIEFDQRFVKADVVVK